MSYNYGVPATELCCPTCGEHFTDFACVQTRKSFECNMTRAIARVPATPWYILCPNGHKWTIKTIWRSADEPDDVLLGRYLGEA